MSGMPKSCEPSSPACLMRRTGGYPLLRARPPVAEQQCEVQRADRTVAVQIRRALRARTPTAQQHGEVESADVTVAVQIRRAFSLIGSTISVAVLTSTVVEVEDVH